MKVRAYVYGVPLLILGAVLVSGCNQQLIRGKFGDAACPAGMERVGLPTGAAYALYLDKDGNLLGTRAEDLEGTLENQMCPTPPASGPGACPTGYCLTPIPGTNMKYCRRC